MVEHFGLQYYNELGWHCINNIMIKATTGGHAYIKCTNDSL